MRNPLLGRPLAFALTALMALGASLTVPNPTGFEWVAFVVGLLSAIAFWIQCFCFQEL